MRSNAHCGGQFRSSVALLLILGLFLSFTAQSQQLPLRDFVIFGGGPGCSTCGVQIGTSTTLVSGKVGSYGLIKTTGNSQLNGSIHSGNRVELANSNSVKGDVTAANNAGSASTAFVSGSNTSISGNVYVNGNISIGGGSVSGKVIQPASKTYSGPTPAGGRTVGTPPLPVLPQLPAIATFAAAGTTAITANRSLTPNSYGAVSLTGGKTITFSGVGTYVFSSIKISGNSNKFVFDFGGSATGMIILQVWGDVDLDKLTIQVNGGSASRIFMEVHGTGSTSASGKEAWRISNGASGSGQTVWYGTVWAPYGDIVVGAGASSSKIEGALWSGTTVLLESGVSITNVPMAACTIPVAAGGADQTITCPATQTVIGTTFSVGSEVKWTTSTNGLETVVGTTATISVSKPGTYRLTVKNACGDVATDEVVVAYKSCVEPINQTPNGKVDNVIGAELTNLTTKLAEAKKYLVIVGNDDSVLIEAIAVIGKENDARNFLLSLGLTKMIPNGNNYQIISGQFPIARLNDINLRPDIINHCRPVFLPLGNAGVTTSEGDRAMGANLARGGFTVGGASVKIGVISDSYNRLGNNPAAQDVQNDDLPGTGNPEGNTAPVQVLQDLPQGRSGTDEGRAMMQIVHDVAPKSPLAFRTGFNSAGDFAQGIRELKNAGCKVIVDDVTYITEPFFQDGVVSLAVNEVAAQGVTYFTSAGNFGTKSYTSTFNRAPSPGSFAQYAHNFGGGDVYQRLKLKSGTYTIVLQWQDNIYSLAQSRGTINDLDIYLVDPSGRIGFNRNNIGGDPLEVLSFSINLPDTSQVVEADLLITKADQSADNPTFKYIVFRGNAVIDEYYSGQPLQNKSTIFGHANSAGSIAVGAVLFSNTAPYGNTPSIASFSSTGGTPVFNGTAYELRAKPELTAPNGVNTSTTVAMGPDNDGLGHSDGFPNFFGTSAAAPHAAAAAALVLDARKKFYNEELTPSALRYMLFNSAQAMQPDGAVGGVNYKAGYGLVQPDAAIRSFANPTPKLNALVYDPTITPGRVPFTLTVTGDYLSNSSVIYFRGQPLTTTRVSSTELQAQVATFVGNPAINIFTPSFNGATGDGGRSNTLYFFAQKRDTVTIVADNKKKKFGEVLPVLTTTILVNGDSLRLYNLRTGKNLTPADLGVATPVIRYTTPGISAMTDVGTYQIRASRSFDASSATDNGLLELYIYDSTFGNLQITRLPVTVSPRDTAIVYGEPLDNFHFNYVFDPTANLADRTAMTNAIQTAHNEHTANNVLGVLNVAGGGAVVVFNGKIYQVFNNASVIIAGRLYPVLNLAGGGAVVVLNGEQLPVVNLAGGGAVVVLNGVQYPVLNGGAVVVFNGELLPVIKSAVSGGAVVVLNGEEYPVVNLAGGGAVVVLNGQEVPVVNAAAGGGAVVVFNGRYYPVFNSAAGGGAVVVLNGQEVPVVNSAAGGGAVVVLNGQELPVVNGSSGGAVIFDGGKMLPVIPNVAAGGAVVVLNGSQQSVPYLNGVGGGAVVVFNGQILPVVNLAGGGAVVVLNGVQFPVKNSAAGGGAVVVLNGQEVPLVNSVSPATLTNMSMMASANAVANKRIANGQTDGLIDVSSNAVALFNTSPTTGSLINAYPYVNARTMVEANAIAGGAVTVLNSAAGGGAVTVLNGSNAYVNSNTLGTSSSTRTPVIVDEADVNSAVGNQTTIQMEGINLITGITCGEQTLIPATLLSPNFDIRYGNAKVNITKAPITVKATDLTKTFGEYLALSPGNFSLSSGMMKYAEKLVVVSVTSAGAPSAANVGGYDIVCSKAVGSYGTDTANYQISYQKGTLTVTPSPCPVVTHSQYSNFTSTDKASLSLWLNVEIKVKGQLTKVGDYIAFKGGRVTLENISSSLPVVDAWVPNGLVIAAAVSQPVTRFDPVTQAFITRVPVGYNSTADVFITGAILNSGNGFTKGKNPGSIIRGIFQSNVNFNGQWNFSMAAYKAAAGMQYVQYNDLIAEGKVVAAGDTYKAGTPTPWLSRITGGGYGNGGTNYTGSQSNYNNFSSCETSGVTVMQTSRQTPVLESEAVDLTSSMLAYPNPASSLVTLRFVPNEAGTIAVNLYNANGTKLREVYRGRTEAKKAVVRLLDTSALPDGMYLIQILEKNHSITQKLLIRH